MKDVQCYEVFGGIALKNHAFSIVFSVVSFDIAGTLKQKVGAALPASGAPPTKRRFDDKRKQEILVADSVGR